MTHRTHVIRRTLTGIQNQTYCAIIACLLIRLWSGRKPTLRTFEMICSFLMGWADETTRTDHIAKRQQHDAATNR